MIYWWKDSSLYTIYAGGGGQKPITGRERPQLRCG